MRDNIFTVYTGMFALGVVIYYIINICFSSKAHEQAHQAVDTVKKQLLNKTKNKEIQVTHVSDVICKASGVNIDGRDFDAFRFTVDFQLRGNQQGLNLNVHRQVLILLRHVIGVKKLPRFNFSVEGKQQSLPTKVFKVSRQN